MSLLLDEHTADVLGVLSKISHHYATQRLGLREGAQISTAMSADDPPAAGPAAEVPQPFHHSFHVNSSLPSFPLCCGRPCIHVQRLLLMPRATSHPAQQPAQGDLTLSPEVLALGPPVGSNICRIFEVGGELVWFVGEVTAREADGKVCVRYTDGDEEELTVSEALGALSDFLSGNYTKPVPEVISGPQAPQLASPEPSAAEQGGAGSGGAAAGGGGGAQGAPAASEAAVAAAAAAQQQPAEETAPAGAEAAERPPGGSQAAGGAASPEPASPQPQPGSPGSAEGAKTASGDAPPPQPQQQQAAPAAGSSEQEGPSPQPEAPPAALPAAGVTSPPARGAVPGANPAQGAAPMDVDGTPDAAASGPGAAGEESATPCPARTAAAADRAAAAADGSEASPAARTGAGSDVDSAAASPEANGGDDDGSTSDGSPIAAGGGGDDDDDENAAASDPAAAARADAGAAGASGEGGAAAQTGGGGGAVRQLHGPPPRKKKRSASPRLPATFRPSQFPWPALAEATAAAEPSSSAAAAAAGAAGAAVANAAAAGPERPQSDAAMLSALVSGGFLPTRTIYALAGGARVCATVEQGGHLSFFSGGHPTTAETLADFYNRVSAAAAAAGAPGGGAGAVSDGWKFCFACRCNAEGGIGCELTCNGRLLLYLREKLRSGATAANGGGGASAGGAAAAGLRPAPLAKAGRVSSNLSLRPGGRMIKHVWIDRDALLEVRARCCDTFCPLVTFFSPSPALPIIIQFAALSGSHVTHIHSSLAIDTPTASQAAEKAVDELGTQVTWVAILRKLGLTYEEAYSRGATVHNVRFSSLCLFSEPCFLILFLLVLSPGSLSFLFPPAAASFTLALRASAPRFSSSSAVEPGHRPHAPRSRRRRRPLRPPVAPGSPRRSRGLRRRRSLRRRRRRFGRARRPRAHTAAVHGGCETREGRGRPEVVLAAGEGSSRERSRDPGELQRGYPKPLGLCHRA